MSELYDVFAKIKETVRKWQAKHTPKHIEQDTIKYLEKRKEEIIISLLGFEKSFGDLRVDHCNGRAGESAAGDYLKQVQQKQIHSWFASVEFPDMRDDVKKAMMNSFKQDIRYEIQRKVDKEIETLVDEALNEIKEQYDVTALIKQEIQLENLLLGKK